MTGDPTTHEVGVDLHLDLPLFTGPFRLLAQLILDQKMDVCDVRVAEVTDAFLKGGQDQLASWSLEQATWFLATCAVLLELKVGRLLPKLRPELEEDLLGGVSPDLLYARSLELAAFRRVAVALAERIAEASRMVARNAGPPPELAHLYPDVMEKVTPEALAATVAALLAAPQLVDISHVQPIRASFTDALAVIRGVLEREQHAHFKDLLEGCRERIDVVVRFLAVLELYREGRVELAQAEMFGDIAVHWNHHPSIEVETSA